jgi:hypothetical protein
MKTEFDPSSELHHFGFLVKAVDPGCTVELQIEEKNGHVVRITSTESPERDFEVMRSAVVAAFERFFQRYMR